MKVRKLAFYMLGVAAIAFSAGAQQREGKLTVTSSYSPDVPFSQFMHLWSENWGLRGEDGEPKSYASKSMPLGAYIHVFVHNDSSNTTEIKDVDMAGVSLKEAITFSDHKAGRRHPASIHFSRLVKPEIERLVAAGEPVWWKAEPPTIPSGAFGEVVIRLRRPLSAPVALELVSDHGLLPAWIAPEASPRFESISFASGLKTVYAYIKRSGFEGAGKKRIMVDGQDVSARTEIFSDGNVDVSPIVIHLAEPLEKGSLHFFEASMGESPPARAAVRAWSEDFVYGMWGYVNQGDTEEARVNYFMSDLKRHNINTVMHSYGSDLGRYLAGEGGLEHSRATGIRAMRPGPGKDLNPVYYFLMDEPDAHDFAVTQLPPAQRLGTLGQDVVRTSREFRLADPKTPQLLNVDNTYKPENWYMYSQLPDIYCADPYFQSQQQIVWSKKPAWAASFLKPTYVLGVATICNWACAPRPLHIILNAVKHGSGPDGFRYATPEEKTVELFYALSAGTKAISYWWYTPYGEFCGCGGPEKEAIALWNQIGRLGAQVRTAGPILNLGCSVNIPVKGSAKLWTRVLLAGSDTMMLLAVNDSLASDRLGTVVVPLAETKLRFAAPAWLKPVNIFEITPDGLAEVNWKNEGTELDLDLKETRVARMIIISQDKLLRARLQRLYDQFAMNRGALTSPR